MGAYTSLHTLCTYLESDVSADGQAERNFWVSNYIPYIALCLEVCCHLHSHWPTVCLRSTGDAAWFALSM